MGDPNISIGQISSKDVQQLADQPANESSANPSKSTDTMVKYAKLKKLAVQMNATSPFAKMINNELQYFESAAQMLTDDEDLRRIYSYDPVGVQKLAEVLRSIVEAKKAKDMLEKRGKAEIEKLMGQKGARYDAFIPAVGAAAQAGAFPEDV